MILHEGKGRGFSRCCVVVLIYLILLYDWRQKFDQRQYQAHLLLLLEL